MIFLTLLPYIAVSFILGIIIKFLEYTNIINNICFKLMNHSRLEYDEMYVYVSTYIYWLLMIFFAVIISLVQKQNILLYLCIERKYIIYIFINIFAVISSFEFIMSVISILNSDIKINTIFNNILLVPSVDMLYSSRSNPKWTLIMFASIIKCLFFNGVIYLAVKMKFSDYSIFFTIFIVSILFSLEEILRVNSIKQALIFTITCFVVTAINTISFEYSGSLIPSIFANISFTLYYFGQFENMDKFYKN
ncbi:hypothetical protein BHAMNSH16_04385 [Brachyspira hampsonii]|uniref:Uncharacterized protein n=2 Tax=Brachyspira hampsonii TaxID=1287055 RepID=A0AAC9XJK9_9SPIR|nr:hypothetical protein [Brachyspira hampsonii]ASJ20922.1 hypothetical protein BHAMNSH16_04385 [Brachyspira hampsonii]OEJ18878.1 hypothetical protein A9496_05570 [Brachyspira hampsonii]